VALTLLLACAAVIAYDLSRRAELRGDGRGLAAGSRDSVAGLLADLDAEDDESSGMSQRPELLSGAPEATQTPALRLRLRGRDGVILARD